ncbi:MAG: hypothetical protein ACOYBY_00895 [Dermatophilaceae bacterium]
MSATPADEPPAVAAVQDRGQFAHAVCRTCGWVGPARRSRGSARRDGAHHEQGGHPTTVAGPTA